MEIKTYLEEKERMCKSFCSDTRLHCSDECPLFKINLLENQKDDFYNCDYAIINYTDKAIEVVEKWSKENPIRTYKSVMLEKFPECDIDEITNNDCIEPFWGANNKCDNYSVFACNGKCAKCWDGEYKE